MAAVREYRAVRRRPTCRRCFLLPSSRTTAPASGGWLWLARVVVGACLWISALAACGVAAPTPEPVTIRFAHRPGFRDYYEPLVDLFHERFPHINVELTYGGFQGFQQADVFALPMWDMNTLQRQVGLLTLDTFIEQDSSFDLSDIYPETLAPLTTDGKIWALPAGLDVVVMYYNRDLFDAYDVPYPQAGWTWDGFLDRAIALRDPAASAFGYAPVDPFMDSVVFIYQHGGRIFDDLAAPTRTTFDDPRTIEALDWFGGLIHRHNVAPTVAQQTEQEFGRSVKSGVYLGKVGMWLGWFSERGGQGGPWPGPWQMDWGMAPLPSDAQSVTLEVVTGLAVTTQAPHPEACWQWVAFLSEQEPFGEMPARKSIAESEAYRRGVGTETAAVAEAALETAVLPSPQIVTELGSVWGVYGQALDRIVRGSSTAEEAMSEAQQTAEKMNP
jgi:multiple sugar transport system substrate-binding protein